MSRSGLLLMIALLALVAGGKAILYDTLDPDCFWHLRVAEQLHRDGIGPLIDDISFASDKTPWTPYSWLAELGMKSLWDFGGYRAAIISQAMMMAAFVIFVALSAKEMTREENPMAVVIATVFAMFLSLPYLSFRPVTFAIVLLALCTWLLLRDRRLNQQTRAVWLIVPITVIIANCHFFAVLVPLWVGALLLGSSCRRYIVLLALALAACFATPMLPGMLEAIWRYQFADPMISGGVVAEFRPFWTSPTCVAILIAWLAMIWNKRERFSTGERIWLIAASLLYLRLGRFAPVFAPIAAASLARALPQFTGEVIQRKPIRIAIASILVIGFVRIASAIPDSQTSFSSWVNRHGPDTPGYPCAAADYVAAHISSGRIINEFTWGGYLAWRLGGEYQVLLDGRTQLYSPQFWRQAYLGNPGDSRSILASAGAQAAIVPLDRSRFRSVLVDMGWQSAYRDDRAEVLLSPAMNASINP